MDNIFITKNDLSILEKAIQLVKINEPTNKREAFCKNYVILRFILYYLDNIYTRIFVISGYHDNSFEADIYYQYLLIFKELTELSNNLNNLDNLIALFYTQRFQWKQPDLEPLKTELNGTFEDIEGKLNTYHETLQNRIIEFRTNLGPLQDIYIVAEPMAEPMAVAEPAAEVAPIVQEEEAPRVVTPPTSPVRQIVRPPVRRPTRGFVVGPSIAIKRKTMRQINNKRKTMNNNSNSNNRNNNNLRNTKRQRPNNRLGLFNSWLQPIHAHQNGGSKRGRLTRKQKRSTRL